jgi:hypothetical protein
LRRTRRKNRIKSFWNKIFNIKHKS